MRAFALLGAVNGFLAVAAGAFGAHGLRERLDARALEVYEIAVRYQMYHALALIAVALIARRAGRAARVAGIAFTAGIVVFSGSLYVLALSGVKVLGAITPVGGVSLLVGWIALAYALSSAFSSASDETA